MKSTADFDDPAPYIGVDLTDRYARGRRPVDVCGLWPAPDGTLAARFWAWTWPAASEPLLVEAIATEIRSARAAMIDGPQALATVGHNQRACERALGAPGKTPDHLYPTGMPFGGYLRSSVELFATLYGYGVPVTPRDFLGGACEYYPGDTWPRLYANGLFKKDTRQGRFHRHASLGVTGLPDPPSHDQNDACLGAVLAAAAEGRISGLDIEAVGEPLAVDPEGILREGQIATPQADDALLHHIHNYIRSSAPADAARRAAAVTSNALESRKDESQAMKRAEALYDHLLQRFRDGDARTCTYADAHERIFGYRPNPWLPSHAGKVIGVARATAPATLDDLGTVRLDTFIVAAGTRKPGSGYWRTSDHGENDWSRALGGARFLE